MRRAAPPARAWQRMLSGRRLDILDPSPLDIELDDIAHGLARTARWNGQTSGAHAFSVAQHSCFVEAIAAELEPSLPPSARLHALLHDAPEYVIGDAITPLKSALGETYGRIEARLLGVIHLSFGLPVEAPAAVHRLIKRADRIAAWAEATQLAGFSVPEADAAFARRDELPPIAREAIVPWPTAVADARFRERVLACRGHAQPAAREGGRA